MANQETAYGLRPIGLVGAAANSNGLTQYEIASDNTGAIFQYGIVVSVSCWGNCPSRRKPMAALRKPSVY